MKTFMLALGWLSTIYAGGFILAMLLTHYDNPIKPGCVDMTIWECPK